MVPFVKNGKKQQQHRHFIEALKELTNEKMWIQDALQLCKQLKP
jgi:hypothetical protein